MGKVRRYRQKYHLSKVKAKESTKEESQTLLKGKPKNAGNEKPVASDANIFAGLDISIDSLTKSLPQDFDAKSIASTKSRKELKLEEQHLKKKVKMKLRRERFLQKLDVTQQAIKDDKRRKKKKPGIYNKEQQGKVLPLLESLLKSKISNEGKSFKLKQKKSKGILKMKKRLKQQTDDTKLMKKILKDHKFQSNPGQTIVDFLKEKVAMER